MNREEDIRDYMKAAIDESNAPGSCASVDQLAAYLQNECDGDTHESIQTHLVGCDECRSVLLDLAGFVAAAQSSPAAPEPVVERKWKELQRRVRSEDRPAGWWTWTTWLSGLRPALVFSLTPSRTLAAACLIIAATAVSWAVLMRNRLSTIEVAYRNLSNQHSQSDGSRQRVEAEVARMRAPQLNLAVFDVLPSGSADRSGSARHANIFTLPEAGRFALVLSGAVQRVSAEYSIAISNEGSGEVYFGQGLKPDNHGNLLMTVDRSFLPAGRYRLIVGEKRGSGFQTVADYVIRLVDQRESPKIENPAQK